MIKKTLEPTWNEVLSFDVGKLGDAVGSPMLLKLMDKDSMVMSRDDALGELSVDLKGLLHRDQIEVNRATLDKIKHGTVTLRVQWTS